MVLPLYCRMSKFDDVVLSQIETIRRIGVSLLNDRSDLDDFTQDVLAKVYAHREQLKDAEKLTAWIHTIARNTARRANRQPRPVLVEVLPEVPSPKPSPFEAVSTRQQQRLVVAALDSLGERDRELLCAFYFDETGYEALAARYELSYRAIFARVTRARERLRVRLESVGRE